MAAWADRLDVDRAWHDVIHYRGVSSVDVGYVDLYFRMLDRVRATVDEAAAVSEPQEAVDAPLARAARIVRLVRSGALPVSDAVRLARERAAESCGMLLPPKRTGHLRALEPALVVAAAPNATGFPVLESLRDTPGWHLVFASWSRTVEPRVHALNVTYMHMADTYRRRYVSLRKRHARQMEAAFAVHDASALGRTFSNIAGVELALDLEAIVRDVCVESRVQTDLYFDLLHTIAPRVLIVFNDASIRERPAVRVAAQLGIPSIALQHGLFLGHVYRSVATDRMIVWGRTPRDFWLERGCSPERITEAGGFGHGKWSRPQQRHTAARPTVLYLGQNPATFISPALYRSSIAALSEAARRLPNVQFVIRPHPAESAAPYEVMVGSSGLPNAVLRRDDALTTVLRDSDVVVTLISTAGLEAMLLGTPVIVLNPSPEPSLAPFADATLVARDGEQLADGVQRILSDANARAAVTSAGRAYADAYFGALDGAATRAAATVEALALPVRRATTAGARARHALIIDHASTLGGAEFSLESLVENMPAGRWRYTVALPGAGPFANRLRNNRIPVVEVGLESWRWWARTSSQWWKFVLTLPLQVVSTWRWLTVLRRIRPDVVHLNINRLVEPLLAARALGIPAVVHFRDIPSRQSTRFVAGGRIFYGVMNLADAWIANSTATAQDIRRYCRKPLYTIANALDIKAFDTAAIESRAAAVSLLRPGVHHVAMVAGVNPWKRQDLFIDLAKRILRTRRDTAFYVVGDAVNAQYMNALRRQAADAGIEDAVHFLGRVDSVAALMRQLDVLVHTTPHEPFGRVFLEAMAAGVPVIAYDSGGAAEVVVHNVTGVLVPDGPVDAMATAVNALLDDERRRGDLGRAGRHRVEMNYAIERHCDAVASVYETMFPSAVSSERPAAQGVA
jgi:glycosyltransferase involved in cell wall biosynthesis